MWFLGIDIGKNNLGYCLFNGKDIRFNIFNSEKHLTRDIQKKYGSVIFARIKIFNDFVLQLIKNYDISYVIIEKQVQKNIIAKNIESCLCTLFIAYGINVKIYDPKNKFRYLNPEYNSKKKEHKKIVQTYAKTILKTYGYPLNYFNQFSKKDDISDAMCMAVFSWYEKYKIGSKVINLLQSEYII